VSFTTFSRRTTLRPIAHGRCGVRLANSPTRKRKRDEMGWASLERSPSLILALSCLLSLTPAIPYCFLQPCSLPLSLSLSPVRPFSLGGRTLLLMVLMGWRMSRAVFVFSWKRKISQTCEYFSSPSRDSLKQRKNKPISTTGFSLLCSPFILLLFPSYHSAGV
jgi:hypothetical protein